MTSTINNANINIDINNKNKNSIKKKSKITNNISSNNGNNDNENENIYNLNYDNFIDEADENNDETDIDDETYTNNQDDLSSVNLIKKIDKKVQQLDRIWQELNRNSLNYNNLLYNFYQNLQNLNNSFELVSQKLNENEHLIAKLNTVSEIDSDKLSDELEKVKNFQLRISSYQPLIDDMCTQFTNINQELQSCGSLNENNLITDAQTTLNSKFDDLNLRWSNIQSQLQEKYLHMYSLIESSGADIFLKLSDSVQPPWQRSVSSNNKVPYYIKYELKAFIIFSNNFLSNSFIYLVTHLRSLLGITLK